MRQGAESHRLGTSACPRLDSVAFKQSGGKPPFPTCEILLLVASLESLCLLSKIIQSRTYSNSNGLPLIPVDGGAIQLAILPGSVTAFIRLRTYSRSSTVGSQTVFRRSNSSFAIKFPARSKWRPAYSPT